MSIELTIQEQVENISLIVNEEIETVAITVQEVTNVVELSIVENGPVIIEGEANIVRYIAGEIMSSGTPVLLINNQAFSFNPLVLDHAARIIGFAVHSSTPGQELAIRIAGIMQNDGYELAPGEQVFATASGVNTQYPSSGIIAPVGQAISTDKFIINFLTPIIRF